MPDLSVAPALVAALLSFLVVGAVRRTALRHDLLDHPNERSSHSVATPRGGGLGLIAAFVVVALGSGVLGPDPLGVLCLAGLVAVGGVGWLDDRHTLPVGPRLVVHAVAGCLVGAVAARATTHPLVALVLFAWWAFWTVSSINVVNFMDGINGLVVSQLLVFGTSLGLLMHRAGAPPTLAFALAGACVGFLPWNFPHARIFLGDVGSGALGCALAWLGAVAMTDYGLSVTQVYLPIVPLFADAATTMFIRWREGERLTTPHRRHLYQRLANGGMGHTRVTLLYALAAVVGSFVAHFAPAQPAWIIAFLMGVVVAGRLLERRVWSGGRS